VPEMDDRRAAYALSLRILRGGSWVCDYRTTKMRIFRSTLARMRHQTPTYGCRARRMV